MEYVREKWAEREKKIKYPDSFVEKRGNRIGSSCSGRNFIPEFLSPPRKNSQIIFSFSKEIENAGEGYCSVNCAC